MIKQTFLFKIILCIIINNCCYSQVIVNKTNISIKEGLINNAVIAFFKDKNGFLWIQSYNSLQRWNGQFFYSESTYIHPDSLKKNQKLKQALIIETDQSNTYYIIDDNSKLYKTNNLKLHNSLYLKTLQERQEFIAFKDFFFKKHQDSTDNFLKKINYDCIKSQDGYWILELNQNLIHVSKNKGIKNFILKIRSQHSLYVPLTNKLIFLDLEKNTYNIIDKDSILYKNKLNHKITNFYRQNVRLQKLNEKNFVLIADGTLYKLNINDESKLIISEKVQLKETDIISNFYLDELNNTLYIGSYTSGFTSYNLTNNQFRYLENKISTNYTYSLFLNNNKVFDNINFYNQYQNKNFPVWNWLLTSTFCSINKDEYIYVFLDNLAVVTKNKIKYTKIKNASSNPFTHYIKTDSVVYCKRESIDKFYPKSSTYITNKLNQWPTFNKQLYCIANTKIPNTIYAIIDDELQALNMHTKTSRTLAKGIIGEPRNIDFDSINNGLFVTTKYNGFYYYTNKKLIKLPMIYNNKSYNPHYVLQDKEGDYWLPTNEGLYCMFKNDFTNYLNKKTISIPLKRFGKEDGLSNEEFNGGFQNASFFNNDSIYMATANGTVVFHTSLKHRQKKEEGNLVLDYISLDSTIIENKENIILPPNFKLFSIKTDYPFIYSNGNLEYRLLGSNDTNWHNLNDAGLLEIKNLIAGAYKIEIRPSTKTNKIINIPFTVTPYWYNTWWAKLVFLAGFATAFFIIFMWQWQTLKSNNLELLNVNRTKLLSIIAHDLRSPINSYIGLADDIKYLIKKRDFNIIDQLGNELDEKSRNLTLLVTNVLNWSLYEQGLATTVIKPIILTSVLTEILPAYLDIANFRNIKLDINVPENTIVNSDYNALSLIIRNLIDNAIKHSINGTQILIKFYIKNNKKCLAISNTLTDKHNNTIVEVSEIFNGTKSPEPHSNNLGLGIASIYNNSKLLKINVEVKYDKQMVSFTLIFPSL